MNKDCPNLDRTVAALMVYDAYEINWDEDPSTFKDQILKKEGLAMKVGIAFGTDTADRNNYEDCVNYVRPGRCPSTDSFIRKMVALWLTEKGE